MDASLMRGRDREAGAVAGVTRVRNPILAARAVLEASEHVFLVGDGADAFARDRGLATEDNAWFVTDRRRRALDAARRGRSRRPNVLGEEAEARSGTVGAVALDARGHLAAGTSTGGMANKAWGRVGDSPVIGAGTWAGTTCAVSCTGWGERFLTDAVAHDVHARMVHGRASLRESVRSIVLDELQARPPGSGGLVAIDRDGNVELCFNTRGMYRGWIDEAGRSSVEIFGETD
jgi:beta-aspartyl-peptidase (threonine type)